MSASEGFFGRAPTPPPDKVRVALPPQIQKFIRERDLTVSPRMLFTIDALGALVILVLLLVYFKPTLLFLQTNTTGGDTGAHIYAPWFVREELFPRGSVTGWSNDWYAGFPIMHFYFPLVIVIQALLSYLMPYEIAFKLGTIIGTFFMPIAMYMLFRLLRVRWPGPLLAAAGTIAFLFMDSFNIYGGNIASSLAGEYSFSLSLGLCLVFMGLAYRIVTEGAGRPLLAAIVLGLAALSHLVPVMVVALVVPLLGYWAARRAGIKKGVGGLAAICGLAFAFAAFWAIPFAARLGYTTNMKWGGVATLDPLAPRELWIYLVVAAIGAALGLLRRDRRVLLLAAPGVLGALIFVWLPDGHIWNGRFLPFWYLTVYALGAYGLGTLVPSLMRLALRKRAAVATGGIALGLVIAIAGWLLLQKEETFIDFWIAHNYGGYERQEDFPIFEELNSTLASLPPGRVMWEPSNELGRFGTPIALMAIPYFSGQPTMEGIYFESSITTPFHFIMASELSATPSNPIRGLPYNQLDIEKGLDHMQLLNVSYYVAFSEEAVAQADDSDRLEEIDSVEAFHVYEVEGAADVVVPERQPNVLEGADWFESSLDWYNADDLSTPVARDGPGDWSRTDGIGAGSSVLDAGGTMIDAEIEHDSISFRTDAVGQPHWVKTSYFPNWKAEGAEGPYQATPSMMLVVPTQEEVTLSYRRTWAEWLGLVLTLAAIAIAAVPALRRRFVEMAAG